VNVPWSSATGAAIGADWLLEAIAPAGDFGRRARAAERAFRFGDEAAARAALQHVAAIADAVPAPRLAAVHEAIAAAPDPGAALVRAAGGGILADADFFELSRFLDSLTEVAALATGPLLAAVAPHEETVLRAELARGRTLERTFYLADAFSAELGAVRAASAAAQARYDTARARLAARVTHYAGLEHVRDGEFVLLRDRIVPPLVAEIRIIREALTYLLCELALDDAALKALAERDRTLQDVAAAEERTRAHLSMLVARAAAGLEDACRALGALDTLVARARFVAQYQCTLPKIGTTAAVTTEDARYLPLVAALGARSRNYVPVSLAVDGIGIVTGPNMGGKTAALRTLGFVVACVALGVPVPASRARVPLVDEIVWLGVGTLPEDDGLLSAFGTEVVELRSFLERRPVRPLVLIDEFARTTSPREGRALLIALVETLRDRGAFGLAATHFTGVAASANAPHYAVGGTRELPRVNGLPLELRAALERIAGSTDYRLSRVDEGAVPKADALALADALGLDAAFVARARAAL